MNEGQSKQYRDETASKLKDIRNLDKGLAQQYQEKVAETPEYQAARDEKVIAHKQEIEGVNQKIEKIIEKMKELRKEEDITRREINLLESKKEEIRGEIHKQEELINEIEKKRVYEKNYDKYLKVFSDKLNKDIEDLLHPLYHSTRGGSFDPTIHSAEVFLEVCEKQSSQDFEMIKEKINKIKELLPGYSKRAGY